MTQFELNLIKSLQRAIRSPFLDWLVYFISFVGSEYFFLAVAAIFLWCIDKRFGYKFLNIYFLGQIFVGAVKTIVRRARPFDADGGVRSVISDTEGYSFPSGHSQSIANISTQTALFAQGAGRLWSAEDNNSRGYNSRGCNSRGCNSRGCNSRGNNAQRKDAGRNKLFVRLSIAGAVATVLVMFSRVYLGQHYFSDVLCGAALGVLVALAFSRVFRLLGDKEEGLMYVILPLTVVFAVVYLVLGENVGGAMKLFGVWGASSLGYFLEKKYVRYEVKSGGVWRQLVKVVLGFFVLVGVLEGLGFLAAKLDARAGLILEYLRYFLAGLAATFALPAFFKRIKL